MGIFGIMFIYTPITLILLFLKTKQHKQFVYYIHKILFYIGFEPTTLGEDESGVVTA